MTQFGYAAAVEIYRERGWQGVLPLPENRKVAPPPGYTGRGGVWPTDEDVAGWREEFARGNTALRLPETVVGIDVDSYGSKPGGASLFQLVEELGPLPSTYRSTSRQRLGDDLSSIRFYRVPEGTVLKGAPAPGIEIVQHHHRYAVVWPSWHPDVDAQYEWWGPDGLEAEPPREEDLPELPERWLEGLRAGAVEDRPDGPGDLRGTNSYSALVERYVERALDGMSRHDCGYQLANQLRDNNCPYDDARRVWMVAYQRRVATADERYYSEEEALKELEHAYAGERRDPMPGFRKMGTAGERYTLPGPAEPLKVAKALMVEWSRDGVPLVRRWRESWLRWREGEGWTEVGHEAVRAGIYRRLGEAVWSKPPGKDANPEEPEEAVEWSPNVSRVRNVMEALAAVAQEEDRTPEPSWLMGRREPPAEEVVAVRNGLLHVPERRLLPPDPRFFSQVTLPLDFDPLAGRPERWWAFLESLWPNDPQAINALGEIFGYLISGRTDLQKIPLLVGPPRSGKGTVARVLAELVGRENVAAPTMASLGTQFGMQGLIGKSLAVIGDARVGGDTREIVARLLGISGEDLVSVDRKNRSYWTGKLGVRFLILSNEVPGLRDASGALAQRFVPLVLRESWLGREHLGLFEELQEELPGIMNWALDGLDRLRRLGRLTVPLSSGDVVATLADTGSPISTFLRECCETGQTLAVDSADLYSAWTGWANMNGYRPGNAATFGRDLRAARPHLVRRNGGSRGARYYQYIGIDLSSEARSEYIFPTL